MAASTLIFIMLIASYCYADWVDDLAEQGKQPLQNTASTSRVPGYSEADKNAIENRLNAIDPGGLEQEGSKLNREECAKNPNSGFASIQEAGAPSKVAGKNFDNLEMFTRGDNIMNDPLSLFNLINNESCRKISKHQERHYQKHEYTTTHTEIIEELHSCEQPTNKFTCRKNLKLTCANSYNCNVVGGIVKDSSASDMALHYARGILTIGNIADNEWQGTCTTIDRDTEFTLKNIASISEFRLIQAGFDDFIQIKINGHIVFVGPHGGTKLEVVNNWSGQVVSTGIAEHGCEQDTNWVQGLNIDLKPYLIEGRNTISMRVIVSGKGEGWIRIAAQQHCCNTWHEDWVNDCQNR